jgi:hypothetical protein
MKAIGTAAATIGVILFAIYVVAWISLVVEHGADAVRIGFTIWPGNVVGLAILALSIVFGTSGWALLGEDRRQE